MDILYIVKDDPKDSLADILKEHQKKGGVTIVDIREDKDYPALIKRIEASDKIICV